MAADFSDKPARSAATHLRYAVLAVGCALAFVTYVHRQSFVRAQTEVEKYLAIDEEQIGYIQAAFLIGYGLFQVPCGLLGDRFGVRHLLAGLLAAWSALTGLTALAALFPASGNGAFVFLLALRFLFGAFQAGFFPLWSRVMTDWMRVSERGTAQGAVWTFSRVGGVLGPFFYLWMWRAAGTWTTPLWIMGGLGLLLAVPFWLWFRNRPEDAPRMNDAERALIAAGRAAEDRAASSIAWKAVLTSSNVWALCLMYGFIGSAGNFNTNLLPSYLKTHRQLSDEATTWMFGLPLAVGSVACVLGGSLSDWLVKRLVNRKWGRRLNGLVGLGLGGLAFSQFPAARGIAELALLLGVVALFNDLVMGPAWAACADIGGPYAGTISGAMNMTGQFLGALGVAFAGWMLRRGHDQATFLVLGCGYVLAGLCWLAIDVTKPVRVGHNHGSGPENRTP